MDVCEDLAPASGAASGGQGQTVELTRRVSTEKHVTGDLEATANLPAGMAGGVGADTFRVEDATASQQPPSPTLRLVHITINHFQNEPLKLDIWTVLKQAAQRALLPFVTRRCGSRAMIGECLFALFVVFIAADCIQWHLPVDVLVLAIWVFCGTALYAATFNVYRFNGAEQGYMQSADDPLSDQMKFKTDAFHEYWATAWKCQRQHGNGAPMLSEAQAKFLEWADDSTLGFLALIAFQVLMYFVVFLLRNRRFLVRVPHLLSTFALVLAGFMVLMAVCRLVYWVWFLTCHSRAFEREQAASAGGGRSVRRSAPPDDEVYQKFLAYQQQYRFAKSLTDMQQYRCARCLGCNVIPDQVLKLLEGLMLCCCFAARLDCTPDFFLKWQRIHALDEHLTVEAPRPSDSARWKAFEDMHLLTPYRDSIVESGTVSVQDLAAQLLIGMDSESSDCTKISKACLGLIHKALIGAVVLGMGLLTTVQSAGGPCALLHPLPSDKRYGFELVPILALLYFPICMYFPLVANARALSSLADRVAQTHSHLADMLRSPSAATALFLPPVHVAEPRALLAWIEIHTLFVASYSSEQALREVFLVYSMLTYVGFIVYWAYLTSFPTWQPDLMSAMVGFMIVLALLTIPPVMLNGLRVNTVLDEQRFLLNRHHISGQVSVAYTHSGVSVEDTSSSSMSASRERPGIVERLSQELALHMTLDTGNSFSILGIKLTAPTLYSIVSGFSAALMYLWRVVGSNVERQFTNGCMPGLNSTDGAGISESSVVSWWQG